MKIITLDPPSIRAFMKGGAGLKRAQTTLLGIPFPLESGWMSQVLGKAVDSQTYDKLLWLRDHAEQSEKKKTRARKQLSPSMKLILEGRSDAGGWNRRQLEVIGVRWPLPNGWIHKAASIEYTDDQKKMFLALRGKTLSSLRKEAIAAGVPKSQLSTKKSRTRERLLAEAPWGPPERKLFIRRKR